MNIATSHFSNMKLDSLDEDDPEEVPHTLFNEAAVNSFTRADFIHWPPPARHNTIEQFSSKDMDDAQILKKYLNPLLGVAVTAQFAGRPASFTMCKLRTRVQVGRFRYSCKVREDGVQVKHTRESWFSILAKNVPAMRECFANPSKPDAPPPKEPWNPDAVLYGRILHFVQITVPGWRAEPFFLAEALLYHSRVEEELDPAIRLPYFNLEPIEFWINRFTPGLQTTQRCTIHVGEIRSQIAIAPKPPRKATPAEAARAAAAPADVAPADEPAYYALELNITV